jgi:hypothetical protein
MFIERGAPSIELVALGAWQQVLLSKWNRRAIVGTTGAHAEFHLREVVSLLRRHDTHRANAEAFLQSANDVGVTFCHRYRENKPKAYRPVNALRRSAARRGKRSLAGDDASKEGR